VEDFPTRIADFLESVATRIRALTVDRLASVITYVTLGLVAVTLVAISFIFLLVGIFRILEELIFKACDCTQAMEISYGAVGGLFLIVGVLLWSRRTRSKSKDSE
jgi:nitrate reductase gamma subunit